MRERSYCTLLGDQVRRGGGEDRGWQGTTSFLALVPRLLPCPPLPSDVPQSRVSHPPFFSIPLPLLYFFLRAKVFLSIPHRYLSSLPHHYLSSLPHRYLSSLPHLMHPVCIPPPPSPAHHSLPQRLPHSPGLLLHSARARLLLPASQGLAPSLGAVAVRPLHRALR
ncbi:unnamed protein product, partial [Closterium sp. NIES-54]